MIVLLIAVVLIVPVQRCTVRNPARGYAEKWESFKQKEKAAKGHSSSERTVFVVFRGTKIVPAESPSRAGGDTRARAPKLIWARETPRFFRSEDRHAADPKTAAALDFHSSATLERELPWQAVQTRDPSRQPTPR